MPRPWGKSRKATSAARFLKTTEFPVSQSDSSNKAYLKEPQSNTMHEARLKVLNLTEILETILLALPIRDALLLQRVCKFWKGVVASSVKLQKELYFIADGLTDVANSQCAPRTSNPLLEPLFTVKLGPEPVIRMHPSAWPGPTWTEPTASFLAMLITRPATNVVTLIYPHYEYKSLSYRGRVRCETGVTMREIWERLDDVAESVDGKP